MSELRDTRREISLSGTWKVRAAEEATRRRVGDIDLDDNDWADIEVPGLWRSRDVLADTDAVLYLSLIHI